MCKKKKIKKCVKKKKILTNNLHKNYKASF